jgi:protein-S-isoprenylcysteine O-methyltransferase Ste14
VIDHWSAMNAALLVIAIIAATTRALCEERFLRERYPEYEAYARTTRRFVPSMW